MKLKLSYTIFAFASAIILSTVCIEPVAAVEGATPAVRTLDAITIEGEIAVPQVLFITSRDYPRYRDGLGLKFRMTTLDVARSVDLPTRLRIVAKHKEEGK